jgi:hypothetical protein
MSRGCISIAVTVQLTGICSVLFVFPCLFQFDKSLHRDIMQFSRYYDDVDRSDNKERFKHKDEVRQYARSTLPALSYGFEALNLVLEDSRQHLLSV